MSRVISPVTGKPYGLAAVCRVWRLARSGVYRPLGGVSSPVRRGAGAAARAARRDVG
jgi:putative transposase